jgi:hypothetical protein
LKRNDIALVFVLRIQRISIHLYIYCVLLYMVSAIQGVCVSCDPQLKEILKALNASEDPEKRFLISDLTSSDDSLQVSKLFIKADALERVKNHVKKYSESLHFEGEK